MNLDAYMDSFGRDLTRAARTRRRRAGRRLALAVPIAVAATAAAIVVPGGGGTVDAIAAARAALAPTGEIVHMKIRMTLPGNRPGSETEQWYAADPVRWRTRQVLRGAGRIEIASSDDRLRVYNARRDVVTIYDDAKLATGPNLFGTDPASDLREQLAKGDVRDEGVVRFDGRDARRLVQEVKHDGFTQRFVYYADPTTFAPLAGQLTILRKHGKALRGPEYRVTVYERLPLNEQTEALLKLDKTPSTRYVWSPRIAARPTRGR
ncbi:hypothetical protein C8N24_0405 [Solirubrobacter pauli]|uniref:Outer membrane lipoprotein-sorting protein n=1 Tax=Solirubrobacter pauli TaxID=166793 RepID=A0A660L9T0_9ACTN|nr:hypothetical protein [Solirubrobacter pauli]RKQ90593.1 hypothetical protein C8N24_0405 [Solirubrobacter pauli]